VAKKEEKVAVGLRSLATWAKMIGSQQIQDSPELQAAARAAGKAMEAIQAGDIHATAQWSFLFGLRIGQCPIGYNNRRCVKAMLRGKLDSNGPEPHGRIIPADTKRKAVACFTRLRKLHPDWQVKRITKAVCEEFSLSPRALYRARTSR